MASSTIVDAEPRVIAGRLGDHAAFGSRRSGWTRLFWPLAIGLLGFAALPFDLPIARWFAAGHCQGGLQHVFTFAETYAHGIGVTAILMTLVVVDAGRRPFMPRVVAAAFGAGLLADLLKMVILRARPASFLAGGDSANATVWETFSRWLPLWHGNHAGQSFPSAHVATAVGLTAGLVWLYPRGRWLFPLFALLAACQRMASGSHFASDVVWGAAAGSLVAVLVLPGGLLAQWFDRLERRLAARRAATES